MLLLVGNGAVEYSGDSTLSFVLHTLRASITSTLFNISSLSLWLSRNIGTTICDAAILRRVSLSLSLSVCFSHREDNNSIRRRHRRNDKHMMRMIPQSICIPAHMFHCLHQTQTHTTHTGRTNEEKQSGFLSVYPHSTHSFTYHRSLPPANHLMHNENDVAKAEA